MTIGLPAGISEDDVNDLIATYVAANPLTSNILPADVAPALHFFKAAEGYLTASVGGNTIVAIEEGGLGIGPAGVATGCILTTSDDTGADICHEQVGDQGSAFMLLRKALGEFAARLALTAGQKIGGFGFSAHNGDDADRFVSAEIAGFVAEDVSDTAAGTHLIISTTPEGSRVKRNVAEFLASGAIVFPEYAGSQVTPVVMAANGLLQRGAQPVFGQAAAFAKAAGPFVHQSSQWNNPLTLNIPALVSAGTYRVGLGYKWAYDNVSNDFQGRLILNSNTLVGAEHRQEPKDSAGSSTLPGRTDQRHGFYAANYLDFAAGDSPTFEFFFRPSDTSYRALAENIVLEFWRVA